MGAAPATREIRIELETGDWKFRSTLTIPTEPMALDDWLPFLQVLANHAAAVSEEAANKSGKRISCAKGCGACCRQLVGISLVEARALARLVEAMPEPRRSEIRRRFEAAATRAEASGILNRELPGESGAGRAESAAALQSLSADYFRQGIDCPFLEQGSCGIHPDRPLVCREYLVTSPAADCARLFRQAVEPVPVTAHLSTALTTATSRLAGIRDVSLPLIYALDWAGALDAEVGAPRDPVETLKILLGEIGEARLES